MNSSRPFSQQTREPMQQRPIHMQSSTAYGTQSSPTNDQPEANSPTTRSGERSTTRILIAIEEATIQAIEKQHASWNELAKEEANVRIVNSIRETDARVKNARRESEQRMKIMGKKSELEMELMRLRFEAKYPGLLDRAEIGGNQNMAANTGMARAVESGTEGTMSSEVPKRPFGFAANPGSVGESSVLNGSGGGDSADGRHGGEVLRPERG